MSESDKRKYFRVVAKIPMEVNFVPLSERNGITSEILHEFMPSPRGVLPAKQDDWDLIDWMKVLNEKLDIIITCLAQGKVPASQSRTGMGMELTFVNISAGGMSFISKKGYNPGDVLSMKMVLPENTPLALLLYGEVVFSKPVKTDFDVNVNFIHTSNEIRNDIATFVFNREREILRTGLE